MAEKRINLTEKAKPPTVERIEGGYKVKDVYHGTFGRLPKLKEKIKGMALHLGTKAAAEERLEGTLPVEMAYAEETKQKLPEKARIIKGDVEIKKPLGSPARPLRDRGEWDPKILKRAKKMGFDSLIYENVVEDPGKLSIAVLDPKAFKPKEVAVQKVSTSTTPEGFTHAIFTPSRIARAREAVLTGLKKGAKRGMKGSAALAGLSLFKDYLRTKQAEQ